MSTVRCDVVRHIIGTASRFGVEPRWLLRRADIGRDTLRAQRVGLDRLHSLWEVMATASPTFAPSTVARSLPLDSLGPSGLAVLTAPNLRVALVLAARAYSVVNAVARWEVIDRPRHTVVRWVGPTPRSLGEAIALEAMASYFSIALEKLTGAPLRPVRVRLALTAPRHARALSEGLSCRVEHAEPVTEIHIDRAALDEVPLQASADAHRYFARLVTAERSQNVSRPFVVEVREAVEALLSDGAPASRVAALLGTSERTPRRRHADEGHSLRSVRDDVRSRLAQTRLERDARLIDVALELGFSEEWAFARAHRRWRGAPPSSVVPRQRGHVARALATSPRLADGAARDHSPK
jgi:AraC-like DNA-binding protein